MEKQYKKELVGKVISTKREKTITVIVETYKKHPLYSKRFKASKKFAVHDENGVAKLGDTVSIIETRPLSATKSFRLKEVLASSVEGAE